MPFSSIPEAVEEFRAGRMLVVVDDEDRENEGDLTVAAEKITPETINFMAKHGRGLICLALSEQRCDELSLPQMSQTNTSRFGTAFCEALDAREGVTTGISAADRATTIRLAMDPATRPEDFARPGHHPTARHNHDEERCLSIGRGSRNQPRGRTGPQRADCTGVRRAVGGSSTREFHAGVRVG